MKIVVVGGSGLIGKQTVARLKEKGHEVVVASPTNGVNAVTGEGLDDALKGATVVVDVSNAPSWEEKAVLEFFEKSTKNLLAGEVAAGVKHHVALSVVGTDGMLDSGYFRAKMAQEMLIKNGKVPYTIVRATQFFEFIDGIAQSNSDGTTTRLPIANFQPIAAIDVSELMAEIALEPPADATIDIAGPERTSMTEAIEKTIKFKGGNLQVVADHNATYFGTPLKTHSLVPAGKARLGKLTLEEWLKKTAVPV